MRRRGVIQVVLIFIMVFFATGCKWMQGKQQKIAQGGVIDFSNWDLSKDGAVRLDGQWKFYWDQLLEPNELQAVEHKDVVLVSVPNSWDKYKNRNEKCCDYGYGTYELNMKIKDLGGQYALKLPYIPSSYKLWVDGELISSNGVVAKRRFETIPSPLSKTVCFKPKGDEVKIVLQVANFKYRKGGILESIYMGTSDQIQRINYNRLAKELFFSGAILMIGLYILMTYRKDKSAIYFGVGCLGLAIRNVFSGEYYILYLFPKLSWLIVLKIEYLSFYATFIAFMVFIHFLFPQELGKRFLKLTTAVGTIFSLIVLITPPLIFTNTLITYEVYSVMVMFYVMYSLIKAIKIKRQNALPMVIGATIFIAAAINDMLSNNKLIHSIELSSLGLLIFVCIQAILLSRSFSEVVKKANAYEGEKEKYKISEILRTVTSTLNSTLELSEIINIILEQLQLLVSYDSAVLLMLNDERVKVSAVKGFDNDNEILNKDFPLVDLSMVQKIVRSQRGITIGNLKESQEDIHLVGNENIKSWMGVPIFLQGKIIGVLSIQSVKENMYSEAEAGLFSSFADQVGMAIRNAKIYSEVKELATYDGLTGLYNRRSFFEIAEKEYKRATRYKHPFSVIMTDIDYFKSVNDRFGHNIGDKTLKAFASELKAVLRETDIIGRYGGEEFTIITNLDKENAVKLAERLRNHIESCIIQTEEFGEFSITASFGVAELTSATQDLYEVLITSDKALYDAKNSGRNKVVSR